MQFAQIPGQEDIKAHLLQEVRHDKISHAQLFLGKNGYGTLHLALAFVQYLFCSDKQQNDSCGICVSCKRMSELEHPDVHFAYPVVQAIAKTSNHFIKEWRAQLHEKPYFDVFEWTKRIDSRERKPIIGTEESLEIIKKLSLKSYEGGYKVMLIWMAETMNPECSNKLLKILEEPPPKTVIILVAEAADRMLNTILSRTQIIRVPALHMDTVIRFCEQITPSRSQAETIAARSEGDLLEALKLLENREEVDLNRELFIQLMRVCFKKDVNAMLDWTDAVSGLSKEGQKLFIQYALHMIRQSLLKNYTDDMLTRISTEEADFLKNFSRFITNNNALDFMQLFNDAHYHLDRNAYAKLLFTQLCFQVMRFIHKA